MPSGWVPKVGKSYPFNVYWLSFISPNEVWSSLQPPSSMMQFSKNRDGLGNAKSADKVIYSLGGYSYSTDGKYKWSMFDSKENAVTFAKAVVSWKKDYRMDGEKHTLEKHYICALTSIPYHTHPLISSQRRIRSRLGDL
jgi:hypothetical protein